MSPHSISPGAGRNAAAHVTVAGINWGASNPMLRSSPPPPTLHGDGGALAGRAHDVERVHQAAGSRQAEAQAVAAGVAILHGELDIGDARALVASHYHEALLARFLLDGEEDFAVAGIAQNVT